MAIIAKGGAMRIECRQSGDGVPVMSLSGRLDATHREAFLSAAEGLFDGRMPPELHVNCAELSYLDSSGLGLLLILRDKAMRTGSSVALVECSAAVRNILTTVQFGRIFRIA